MKKLTLLTPLLFVSFAVHSMDNNNDPVDRLADSLAQNKISNAKGKEEVAQQPAIAAFPQVHFSPGLADVVKNLICHEKEKIYGTMYRFTLYDIAQ